MVKNYADGERVPIRLVQENGDFIELDATSIDMVVERIQSNFGIPFTQAKKFGIDLNQAAVVFEVQGVFTDEAGQEATSGAVAHIDFHQTQVALPPPTSPHSKGGGRSSKDEEKKGAYTAPQSEAEANKYYQYTVRRNLTSEALWADWHGKWMKFPVGYWLDQATANTLPYNTNLAFWFDAGQSVTGVAHTGSVSSFTDKSSNGFTFAANSAPKYYKYGANGRPYVWFDGTDDYFYKTFESALNPNELTIFTVAHSEVDNGAIQAIFSSRKKDGSDQKAGYMITHDLSGGDNRAEFYYYKDGGSDAVVGDTDSITTTEPIITCTTIAADGDGTHTVNLYENGKLVDTDNGASNVYTAVPNNDDDGATALGAWTNDSAGTSHNSYECSGRIYETIMYSGVLSTTNRQLMEAHLSKKYNIPLVGALAGSRHPYYVPGWGNMYRPDSTHIAVAFDTERAASKNEPYGYVNDYRSTSLAVDSGASPTTTSCRLSASIKTWVESSYSDRPYKISFFRGGTLVNDTTLRSVDPGGTNITFDAITAPQVGDILYLAPDTTMRVAGHYGEPVLVLPLKNAGDNATTNGPTYPNYEDGTTRFANHADGTSTALSSLNTTVTRTDEYIAYTLAQLLSHSSISQGLRPVNAAGDTTMDKVFSTNVSTAADGSNTLLTITQVHKTNFGRLTNGPNIYDNLPADKTPLLKGFTGGKSGKTVKSAGDKVQDILGILANSQNFASSNAGLGGAFIDSITGLSTQSMYTRALSGDYITAIQIPYNSLITLGRNTLDANVAQRNLFVTTGTTDTVKKLSGSNTTHASARYDIDRDDSRRNGINGIVTDFNVKRDAAMKAYEFSLKFTAADIII